LLPRSFKFPTRLESPGLSSEPQYQPVTVASGNADPRQLPDSRPAKRTAQESDPGNSLQQAAQGRD
jgi:hypothetical protein